MRARASTSEALLAQQVRRQLARGSTLTPDLLPGDLLLKVLVGEIRTDLSRHSGANLCIVLAALLGFPIFAMYCLAALWIGGSLLLLVY